MNLCLIEGCGRIVRSRGLCASHYQRALRTGSLAESAITRPGRKPAPMSLHCPGVSVCGRVPQARGLCAACYQLRLRRALLDRVLERNAGADCSADGCRNPAVVKQLCKQCYHRARRTAASSR
jgi:hypothetical protein